MDMDEREAGPRTPGKRRRKLKGVLAERRSVEWQQDSAVHFGLRKQDAKLLRLQCPVRSAFPYKLLQ
jgi:hypothetical protein